MAADNLDARRAKIKQMIRSRIPKKEIVKFCSKEFGCCEAAIRNDFIRIKHSNVTQHASPLQKKRIAERDNHTCQYCGSVNDGNNGRFIIEHVVPTTLGGFAKDYNLVYACNSCNMKKRSDVWIPNNLDQIIWKKKCWRNKIIRLAVPKK